MADTRSCPGCGSALPDDAPEGLCPQCLLQRGLGTGNGSSAKPNPSTAAYRSPFIAPPPGELARLFPQLEVLELLGQGGMGAVYKARQPNLDRLVALKILPPDAGGDPAFAERFTREARALARLSHPNIVAVHDFGRAGELYYFLMQYVDGVNLRQLLQAGNLRPEEALKIVPQICEALQYAHEEGVVHRDIKPENVLVDRRGRVKIADFGLAKLLGAQASALQLTGTHQVMGTLHYMAPEQIERPLLVDHRADIYSLGVVFYEMLTGELPLGRFAPPSQKAPVDVRLDDVVHRALEKEPERRYQHASDVKTDVESITRNLPPPPPAPRPRHAPHPPQGIDWEDARQQVSGPAAALFVAGLLNALPAIVAVIGAIVGAAATQSRAPGRGDLTPGWAGILAFAALTPVLLLGLVTMLGAWKMRRLESPGLAFLASILALLPCSIGFVVGCPAGVWALFVLNRPGVRAAFSRRARPDGEPLPEEPSSMTRAAVRTPPPSTGQATASWPGAPPLETWREPDLAAARDQVRAPAAGLFVTGVVALLLPLLVLAAFLVAFVRLMMGW